MVGLVLGRGAPLVSIGFALGVAGAVTLRGIMSTLVYGVGTVDATAYVAASLMLLALTTAACAVPARRACRLDPVIALRTE